jgi:hypothetical protein
MMEEPTQTPLLPPGFHLDSGTLIASLIWGSIAAGYLIYGKKQRSGPAFAGGITMMLASYFASAVWMSVISVAIMAGVYYWSRHE